MTHSPRDKFYLRQLQRYRAHHGTRTPTTERLRIMQCFDAPADALAERVVAYVYFSDRGRHCRTPLNNRFIKAV